MKRLLFCPALSVLGLFLFSGSAQAACSGAQLTNYGAYDGAYTYTQTNLPVACNDNESGSYGQLSSSSQSQSTETHIHNPNTAYERKVRRSRKSSARASAGGSALSISSSESGSDLDIGSSAGSFTAFARNTITVNTANPSEEVHVTFNFCAKAKDTSSQGSASYSAQTIVGSAIWDGVSTGKNVVVFASEKSYCGSKKYIGTSNTLGEFVVRASLSGWARSPQFLISDVAYGTSSSSSASLSISVETVGGGHHSNCTSSTGDLAGCDIDPSSIAAPDYDVSLVSSGGGGSFYSGASGGLNSSTSGSGNSIGGGSSPSASFGPSVYAFGGGKVCESSARPINFVYGFKHKTQSDYSDGALSFVRSYRSDSTWTNDSIGKFWRHNFDRGLSFETVDSVLQATLVNEGGAKTVFLESSGTWIAENTSVTTKFEEIYDSSTLVGYVYITNGDVREYYNLDGLLTRIEYQGNESIDLVYDMSDRLTTVTNEHGKTLTLSYNGNDQVSSAVTPAGTFSYSYDSNDNLETVTKPDSEVVTYHYEDGLSLNALTGITDEAGTRIETYEYDFEGRPTGSTVTSAGDNTFISYNSDDSTTVTNGLGKDTTYYFSTINGFRRIVEVAGEETANCAASNQYYAYDTLGRMTSKTDWEGNETTYAYNSDGLVISVTRGYGTSEAQTTTTTHDSVLRKPDIITQTGKTTDYDYDSEGRVTSITVSDTATSEARTTSYTYNSDDTDSNGNTILGRLASVDGSRTDVTDTTSYIYDSSKRLIKTTNALGHESETLSFDSANRPTLIEDANNVQTQFVYDTLGRVSSSTQAYGTGSAATTSYTYDDVGNVLTITAPNSSVITYAYNDNNRLELITDGLGHKKFITYNALGDVDYVAYRNAYNVTKSYTGNVYDELSRVIESSVGASINTNYDYDKNSNVTNITDGNFNATSFAFDGLNRLSQETDALSGVTSYDLNDLDQNEGTTDPRSNTTSYTYNSFGDVLTETSPDRGAITYTYDKAGNMLTRTDARAETVTYTYDALNRITSTTYASDANLNQTFTYDAVSGCGVSIGRLCSVTDAGGTTDYIYDVLGRLTDVTETRGTLSFTTSYGYDASGTLTGITLPSGRIIAYGLNANGQVSSITEGSNTLASGITYIPFGGIENLTYGNSVALTNSYNLAYQLTNKQHGSLFNNAYTYDDAGNITATSVDNYTYDALYRLTDENTDSYSYDAIGNRLTDPLNIFTYPTTSSILTDINASPVTTDAAGNITQDINRNYTVDAAGHVKETKMGGVIVGTYTYDANNQRTKKTTSAGTTHYVYGMGGLLYGEYDSDGSMTREYVYLNGEPFAQFDQNSSILDTHGNGAYSSIGTWHSSSLVGYNGSTTLYSNDPTASFSWEPSLSVDDTYEVSVWYPTHQNRDSTVTYEIHHTGGLSTVVLSHNDSALGNQWNVLGSYAMNENSFVRVLVDSTSNVTVDAVKFARGTFGTPSYDETIIDNDIITPTTVVGTWNSSSLVGYNGSTTLYSNDPTASFSWEPSLSVDDTYEVSVWYPTHQNRDSTVTYEIHHTGGLSTVVLSHNDSALGNQWNVLGSYAMNENSFVRVLVDSTSNVTVDAVRFRQTSEAITYLHTDHLGTPRIGSDSSGGEVWSWDSDAFGNGTPTGGATVNLRFAGQYFDAETDLHYNWNRYYDPETGRYISSDPIGLAGGLNTYGYVGANPVAYVDPEGLVHWRVTIDYVSTVGGVIVMQVYAESECVGDNNTNVFAGFIGYGGSIAASNAAKDKAKDMIKKFGKKFTKIAEVLDTVSSLQGTNVILFDDKRGEVLPDASVFLRTWSYQDGIFKFGSAEAQSPVDLRESYMDGILFRNGSETVTGGTCNYALGC